MTVGGGSGVHRHYTLDILYSPQFRSYRETKMAARRTQRSASTISREKYRGL